MGGSIGRELRQPFTHQLLELIHLRRLPLLSTSLPYLTTVEQHPRRQGRRPVGDRVPYIPRAMTHKVGREKSISGNRARGAKIGRSEERRKDVDNVSKSTVSQNRYSTALHPFGVYCTSRRVRQSLSQTTFQVQATVYTRQLGT
jgi:hypothetical protein